MPLHSPDKPVFRISVVAELLCVHPQTLRRYELLKLIAPHRAAGNSRYYSQQDVEDIREIRRLTQPPMNVGIEGVRIIVSMRNEIRRLQSRVAQLEEKLTESGIPLPDAEPPETEIFVE